jgi:hypothetical protein
MYLQHHQLERLLYLEEVGMIQHSSVVDMLNVTNNTWFTVNLSQPRYWLASTSSTNKIFFGGGVNSSSEISNVVDIFEIPLSQSMLNGSKFS